MKVSVNERLFLGKKALKAHEEYLIELIDNIPNEYEEYKCAIKELIDPKAFYGISHFTETVWEIFTKNEYDTSLINIIGEALNEHASKRVKLYFLIKETVNLPYDNVCEISKVLNELVNVLNEIDGTFIEAIMTLNEK